MRSMPWLVAVTCFCLQVGLLPEARAGALPPDEKDVPDPGIEQLITLARQKDGPQARKALQALNTLGAKAQYAIRHFHMEREATQAERLPWAELIARCNLGRPAYQVTLVLQPDGSGSLRLWSDRALLAQCGVNYPLVDKPEPQFDEENLHQNPYSRTALIKHFNDGIQWLEGHVEAREEAVEASAVLSFKTIDALASFGNAFDPDGYQLLGGLTITDHDGIRTLRFKKEKDRDREHYQWAMLLFHNLDWEFAVETKGGFQSHNATRTEGNKLIWDFNCYQFLNGQASVEASFPIGGAVAREADRVLPPARVKPELGGSEVAPPAPSNQPVAVVSNRVVHATVLTKELVKSALVADLYARGYIVDLDGRMSQPAGAPLLYQWVQVSGADLALEAEKLAKKRVWIQVYEPGEYEFELTVSLDGVPSDPVRVKAIVEAPNASGVAEVNPPETPTNTTKTVAPAPKPPVETVENTTKTVAPTPKPPVETVENTTKAVAPTPKPPVETVENTTKTVAPTPKPPVETVENTTKTVAPTPKPFLGSGEQTPPVRDPAKARELYAQGAKLMKTFQYEEAVSVLKSAVELNPDDLSCQFDFGVSLLESDHLPEALLAFKTVAEAATDTTDKGAAAPQAEAMMYVGHCFARAGNLAVANSWYRRAARLDKQTAWEPYWQLGNNHLRAGRFEQALMQLLSAEKMALEAKVNDPRLYRDLTLTLHALNRNREALPNVTVLSELGYSFTPGLSAEIAKAAAAEPAVTDNSTGTVVAAQTQKDPDPAVATKVEPPKKDPEPAVATKIEPPKKDPGPAVATKIEPPKKDPEPAVATKIEPPKKDPGPAVATKIEPPKKDPEPAVATKIEPPKKDPEPVVATKIEPPKKGPEPAVATKIEPPKKDPNPAIATKVAPPKVKQDIRTSRADLHQPAPHVAIPKRALPPAPANFDDALAAGQRAFAKGVAASDALAAGQRAAAKGIATSKQETDKAKADIQYAWDEAEYMYRAAWALQPGEAKLRGAFQDLAEYAGAIALVQDSVLKCKVNGLVVLDATSSVVPKNRKLYCVWEQLSGENYLRPENMARPQVGLRIRKPGEYRFELAVSDGVRGGKPVTVTVIVEDVSVEPQTPGK